MTVTNFQSLTADTQSIKTNKQTKKQKQNQSRREYTEKVCLSCEFYAARPCLHEYLHHFHNFLKKTFVSLHNRSISGVYCREFGL